MNDIITKAGDVFLTQGKGFLSIVIRICSRSVGEKKTQVNHVGIIIKEGTLRTCIEVEASYKVQKRRLWQVYGPENSSLVAIYRPINLTNEQINIIVSEHNEQVGKTYGYFKILAHLLDWLFLESIFSEDSLKIINIQYVPG